MIYLSFKTFQVTLEYIDDSGRSLNSKEAFRYLSHKFHGKTSGKLKTEKRQRKVI
jgi:U4/U6.U5 tri-snRNP-associated protein 1